MLIYCEFADAKGFLDTTRMREISQEEQLWYFSKGIIQNLMPLAVVINLMHVASNRQETDK
ncbi:hypothetical protein T01_9854 [Trichinella spiralis]|nr:hypothetical protein T01_9854 [Trichinella spiralis]